MIKWVCGEDGGRHSEVGQAGKYPSLGERKGGKKNTSVVVGVAASNESTH